MNQRTPPGRWCFVCWRRHCSSYMIGWYKTETGRKVLNKAVQNWRRKNKEKWAKIMRNYRARSHNDKTHIKL